MKRSGLKMVFCGAESGSTDTLKRMNKGGTAAELTLDLARRMKSSASSPSSRSSSATRPIPRAIWPDAGVHPPRQADQPAAEIILYVYSPVPGPGEGAPGVRVPETLDEWVSERWQAFALRRDPRTPWSPATIRQRVRDFESVLNAYYPTVTDTQLTPLRRRMLRAMSS